MIIDMIGINDFLGHFRAIKSHLAGNHAENHVKNPVESMGLNTEERCECECEVCACVRSVSVM